MDNCATVRSRRGFTLLEVMIVLLAISILSAGAVIALAPAREAPVAVTMMGDVETFATIEAESFHARGSYVEPAEILQSGKMRLSPGVEVDSTSFSPERVYLRVRHPDSSQRCSVDLSEVSRGARNRVACFGGTARDSAERVGIAEPPGTPVADTVAAIPPGPPPSAALVLSPVVEAPADVDVQPGDAVEGEFTVTNWSAAGRSYALRFTSSDAGLVGVPEPAAAVTIPAGGSLRVRFRSTMSTAAAAGQLAAITLAVEDLEEEALVGRGTFAATTAVRLASARVTPPAPAVVKPESTVVLLWTVRSQSNVARTLDVGTVDAPSLVLVSADGLGRLRLNPGEERRVETRYRLAGPSSAGAVRAVSLTAVDVAAGQYRGEAQVAVTTALALAPPDVVQPGDTSVVPGSTFTRTWTVRSRSNAARSYSLLVEVEGTGTESAGVAGEPMVSIPENGSSEVTVRYTMRKDVPAGESSRVRLTVRDEGGEVEGSAASTITAAEAVVRPAAAAAPNVSGFVGDSAEMEFIVRNAGNSARRYVVGVSSSDPAVAGVAVGTGSVEIPAFGSVAIPVRVGFPYGPVASLDAAVTLAVTDAEASELSATASSTASRINRAPTLTLTGPTRAYAAGEDVPFTLAAMDPDGDVVGFGLEFGDGVSASGRSVRHAYLAPGTYYVRARVVDPFGLAADANVTVRVIAATIGCMDPGASNYDPNATLSGDCTYGPRLVKTEELIRTFVCDFEYGFVQYHTIDTWGRMYDYWSDGSRSPAGEPYQISFERLNLGPVTAAPYGLACEAYNDDWP